MECGSCTLCCELLELHEIPSKIDKMCSMCEPGVGCKIHDHKPAECAKYQCMWRQMTLAGEELRPDKSNILFDLISKDIICGRIRKDTCVSPLIKRQVELFQKDGFSVIIFKDKKYLCMPQFPHTKKSILEVIERKNR